MPLEICAEVGVIFYVLVEAFAVFKDGKVELLKELRGKLCGVFLTDEHGEFATGCQDVRVSGQVLVLQRE